MNFDNIFWNWTFSSIDYYVNELYALWHIKHFKFRKWLNLKF